MSEIQDVVPGEPVESSWGNDVRDRCIQRYTSDGDPNIPAVPISGDLRWLEDVSQFDIYDGAAWVKMIPAIGAVFDAPIGIPDGTVGAPSITRPGQATGVYTTSFPIVGVTVNGVPAAEFRSTSTFFPVAGDSTIGSAPNAYLRPSDGFLAVSTAILAAMSPTALGVLNARIGTVDVESLDLAGALAHILDRIDALEI